MTLDEKSKEFLIDALDELLELDFEDFPYDVTKYLDTPLEDYLTFEDFLEIEVDIAAIPEIIPVVNYHVENLKINLTIQKEIGRIYQLPNTPNGTKYSSSDPIGIMYAISYDAEYARFVDLNQLKINPDKEIKRVREVLGSTKRIDDFIIEDLRTIVDKLNKPVDVYYPLPLSATPTLSKDTMFPRLKQIIYVGLTEIAYFKTGFK